MIALIRRFILGWLRPLPALLLLAVTLCLPFTTSCSSALPPGCTEADYAALSTTCPSEAECNEQIAARHAQCDQKIEEAK